MIGYFAAFMLGSFCGSVALAFFVGAKALRDEHDPPNLIVAMTPEQIENERDRIEARSDFWRVNG